ncbi:MAG: DUF6356 family protein [Alphaproteobacteria bacterium]
MARITDLFTDHPANVGETYLEHMGVAAGFSVKLLGIAAAALVHAILPFLFVKTASTAILSMADKMARRANTAHVGAHLDGAGEELARLQS